MYPIIKVFLKTILLITLFFSFVSFAQTPANNTTNAADQPVDQSNVIFPGCRLSVLTSSSTEAITPEKKSQYIKGCIQDILRFVIVMACLAAILKIAASGLSSLDPTKSGAAEDPIKKTIPNLVIGLFLLLVGWNLVGILNNSFNSVNFLKLPESNHCNINSGCESAERKLAREAAAALATYDKMKTENKYSGSQDQKNTLINTIKDYCSKINDPKYKSEFANVKVDPKVCAEQYADKINTIGSIGAVSPDSTGVKEFNTQRAKLVELKKNGKTYNEAIEQYNELASVCNERAFDKAVTAEGKKVFEECKLVLSNTDEGRKAYYDSLSGEAKQSTDKEAAIVVQFNAERAKLLSLKNNGKKFEEVANQYAALAKICDSSEVSGSTSNILIAVVKECAELNIADIEAQKFYYDNLK